MSEDALERLKQRSRPTVPSRDASLPTSPIPQSLDISISRNLQSIQPNQVKPVDDEIETKQTTMRLEKGISDRLQDLCRVHNVSREVLVEALLIHFEGNPQVQETILNEAQTRNEHRLQAANRKRAQTMMQRFGK
jgi:hypothetical protein